MLPHTIEDEVKEVIAADFVKMRQTSKDTMGSTLHMLLSIARWVFLSSRTCSDEPCAMVPHHIRSVLPILLLLTLICAPLQSRFGESL